MDFMWSQLKATRALHNTSNPVKVGSTFLSFLIISLLHVVILVETFKHSALLFYFNDAALYSMDTVENSGFNDTVF